MISNVERTRGTRELMATEWYYQIMNDVIGPLTSGQLLDKVRSGQVKEDTLIRKDDSQWVRAREVNGLFETLDQVRIKRICPYCGHDVGPPPTTCAKCNRKLVLAYNSRLAAMAKKTKNAKKVQPDKAAEVQQLQEKTDRADVTRYVVLFVLWFGLMFAAPYLIYLATTGRLVFDGDLTVISVVAVTLFVGGMYYLISRLL